MTDLKLTEQQLAVNELLRISNIELRAVLVSELVEDSEKWRHDLYRVEFLRSNVLLFSTQYSCGVGHRTNSSCSHVPDNKRKRLIKALHIDKKNMRGNVVQQWLIVPTAADVLYSLLIDAQCGSETFEYFCSNCGYDTDSRKALETYLACQEMSVKLRKLGGDLLRKLETLLEDY